MSWPDDDVMFKEWQAMRKLAATELRERILSWANNNAPDTMSMASIRSLQEAMDTYMSAHSRQVFDTMRSGIRRHT